MSNLAEMKQHVDRLKKLLIGLKDPVTSTALVVSVATDPKGPIVVMRERLQDMLKAVAPELQGRFKKEGIRLGVGAGIGVFGLTLMGVAALYLMGVITLVVNLALDRMWLSALVVVGGTLVLGCIIALFGVVISRSGAKRLQEATDAVNQSTTALAKSTLEEVQKEVEELQALARQEVEDRKKQALELLNTAKRIAPAAFALLLLCGLVRRRRKKRKRLLAETPLVIKEVIYAEE